MLVSAEYEGYVILLEYRIKMCSQQNMEQDAATGRRRESLTLYNCINLSDESRY